MPSGLFSGDTWWILERSLDASSLRHRVIANNIANADTPQFKASTVEFEAELRRALEGASPRGVFPFPRKIAYPATPNPVDVAPLVVPRRNTVARNDGNNVDIDYEMTALAENDLFYQAIARALNDNFTRLKAAIDGR
ncbi:MAG: flagellar basal body rod protein FlgB [Chloroflexota bacterium]